MLWESGVIGASKTLERLAGAEGEHALLHKVAGSGYVTSGAVWDGEKAAHCTGLC